MNLKDVNQRYNFSCDQRFNYLCDQRFNFSGKSVVKDYGRKEFDLPIVVFNRANNHQSFVS